MVVSMGVGKRKSAVKDWDWELCSGWRAVLASSEQLLRLRVRVWTMEELFAFGTDRANGSRPVT